MCIRDRAYNAVCYDAARRTLIIYDELTRRRTPNRETARLLAERGLTDPDSGPLTDVYKRQRWMRN